MSTYNKSYYESQADSVNLNDLTHRQNNVDMLRRLKNNDADLTELSICYPYSNPKPEYYRTSVDDDGAWLGYFLGKNTALKRLSLEGGVFHYNSDIRLFCGGLCLNRSIEIFEFTRVNEQILHELVPFFKNNHQLSSIKLSNCRLEVGGVQLFQQAISSCKANTLEKVSIENGSSGHDGENLVVSTILALSQQSNLDCLSFLRQNVGRNGCIALATLLRHTATSLTELFLDDASIDDEGIEALVPALLGSRLRNLTLCDNPSISVRGVRSVSLLLNDPNSSLEQLSLARNNLGDDEAHVLALALARNRKLKKMYLCNSAVNGVNQGSEEAFCKALCDTSSVEKTYLSNHSIHDITCPYFKTNDDYLSLQAKKDLSYYMRLNRNLDKKMVAAVKILKNHEHIDVYPFFEWDLQILPLLIGWLENARSYPTTFEKNINQRKLNSIFQFVRAKL